MRAFELRTAQLATHADQAVGVGQGFVELCVDIAQLGVGRDHLEILLQAFDHFRGDAAEGEDSFFHCRRAHRLRENAKQANIPAGNCQDTVEPLWEGGLLPIAVCQPIHA